MNLEIIEKFGAYCAVINHSPVGADNNTLSAEQRYMSPDALGLAAAILTLADVLASK